MLRKILLSLLLCATYAWGQPHDCTPLNLDDVLKESQWRGYWIGIDRLLSGETIDFKTRVSARYLRNAFKLDGKEIKSAKAYIATAGYYELYINGKRIGDDVLAPQQTDFRKSVIYNTLNITEELRNASTKGDSAVVGVILGNGRTVPMRYNKHQKCPFFGFPKCRMDILIEYADGKRQRISSNDKWKATANGPIRSNNEYDGEVYDANMELAGWNMLGYDDSQWQLAERSEIPTGAMYPQTQKNQKAKPLSSFEGIPESEMIKGSIVDVKQNIAGWLAVKVRGNKGDTIRIKYAERLNADSTLYIANLRDAETEDIYVCNGTEGEGRWWQPRFVYHGFRYAEIKGMKDVVISDVKPYVVADDVAQIGSFTSSNATLNTIVRNAWWGILDNYKGFPVDCPQRNERQPWLGDRTVGTLGESYLFDNNNLYTRWMRDICDAQRYDGCIPDVAPSFWNYFNDDVTWPSALPFTCQMLYEQFGNDEAMRNSYPYIKRWIKHFFDDYMKDGIITKDKYGDWCMPPEKPELIHSEDPARQTEGSLISTAYMIKVLRLMSDFGKHLGYNEEAADYTEKAKAMTEAFNRHFLTKKAGTSPEPGHPLYPDSIFYGNNTATANVLPLAFGLVPEDCRQSVIDNVVKNIIVDNDGHVSCGVIGISFLLRTLTANGYPDVAYLIATNTSYPSWGYMAEHSATTIWELWNGDTANPAMNSGNHVMLLGDLLTWCYQDLGGIKNAVGSKAYEHLMMKPAFGIQDLDSIDCQYRTPRGLVRSKWTKTLEKLHWEVTLPEGTKADCVMPDGTVRTITASTVFDVRMPLAYNNETRITGSEFVYDQSIYPETHSASIVELNDGTLLATYFGGTKERNPDVCIYTQRKEKGAETWSAPIMAADGLFPNAPVAGTKANVPEHYVTESWGPSRKTSLTKEAFNHTQQQWDEAVVDSALLQLYLNDTDKTISTKGNIRTACWNPVLFVMPDNEVWLFFKMGRNVKDWTGWVCKSKDGGMTWSEKEALPEGFLGPIKNKPILLDGKLICPSSTEENGWRIHFEIYNLATGTWTKSNSINHFTGQDNEIRAIQPSILVHEKNGKTVLQAVARTSPNKAQRDKRDMTRGKIASTWSYDGGMTWSDMEIIDVPNNQSGIDATTLQKPVKVRCSNGKTYLARHILIYNDFGTLPGTNKGPRTPLSLAVSEDGVTWHHLMTLEKSPISQYSYPTIIQGKDGSIHCIYTWRRQRIAYKKVVL